MRSGSPFFRSNALLEGADPAIADALGDASPQIRVPRKASLWEPGAPADRAFWLRSGVIKVVGNAGARDLTLHFHTKGDLVGAGLVLAELAYHTTGLAYDGDATVYATPLVALREAARAFPELALRVAALHARRNQGIERRLATLPVRSAKARLAGLFLELAADFGVRDSRGVIINLRLTHQEMAALIGATRETVSFSLVELRRAGHVLAESRRVVVTDPEGLRRVASPP